MNDSSSILTCADQDYSVVHFSSANYSLRERLDTMREIYGRTLQKVDIEPLSVEPFHAEAVLRRMPGLAMISCQRSAAIYYRGRELIDHDDIGITVGLSSGYEAQQLGEPLTINRGDAIVMTGAEPASLRVPKHGRYVSIRLPVRAIMPRVVNLDAAYGRPIPSNNKALRLLIRYVSILDETEGFTNPDLRLHAVTHIHDLATLALGPTRDAAEAARCRGAQAARLRTIKEDIAARLDDPGLSVAAVAARHGVLPRYIQRLFETEGMTFTEYVLEQRLARAHRLLADPRYEGHNITTVAFRSGFGDLSYFIRTFRRRYGMTPSEFRAATKTAY